MVGSWYLVRLLISAIPVRTCSWLTSRPLVPLRHERCRATELSFPSGTRDDSASGQVQPILQLSPPVESYCSFSVDLARHTMPGFELLSNPRRLAGCVTATFLYSCLFCLSLHLSSSTTVLQHLVDSTHTYVIAQSTMASPEVLQQAAKLWPSKDETLPAEFDPLQVTSDQPAQTQQLGYANMGQVLSSFFSRLSAPAGVAFPATLHTSTHRKLQQVQGSTATRRSILALNKHNKTTQGSTSADPSSTSAAMFKPKQDRSSRSVLPKSTAATESAGLTRATQGVTLDG